MTQLTEKPSLFDVVQDNLKALENIHAYLEKHADKLPPMSLSGIEVRIEKTRKALAEATHV